MKKNKSMWGQNAFLHMAFGAGVALVAVGSVSQLVQNAFLLGVIFISAGFVGIMVQKK